MTELDDVSEFDLYRKMAAAGRPPAPATGVEFLDRSSTARVKTRWAAPEKFRTVVLLDSRASPTGDAEMLAIPIGT